MEIKDLAGISEPLKKLIEVTSIGLGKVSEPYFIRKNADAKAYELKTINLANMESLIEVDKLKQSYLTKDDILKGASLLERANIRDDFVKQIHQNNLEQIIQKSSETLESDEEVSEEKLDEDWISRFFEYAKSISNDKVQNLWAQILAGEIKKPRSFSLRGLDLLRSLSKEEAEIFTKVGNLAISLNGCTFLGKGENNNILEKNNVNFNDIILMQDLGLLHSGDFTSFTFNETLEKESILVANSGSFGLIIIKKANTQKESIEIILFTKIGQELLKLLSPKENINYFKDFISVFNQENFNFKYGEILSCNENEVNFKRPPIIFD